MSTVYRICKWDEVFETHDSRKLKGLNWVPLPVNFGSNGYQLMIDEFGQDAPAIYGAWCALVCLAATCPDRGVLASSRGAGYSLERIARQTHMPIEVFERLFDWAMSPEVAWIEIVETASVPQSYGITPCSAPPAPRDAGRLPGDSTHIHDTTRQDIRACMNVRPSGGMDQDVIVLDEELWQSLVPRMQRIANVVGGGKPLRTRDRQLAIVAATLARCRLGEQWLDEVLESVESKLRRSPPQSPWAYFRGALVRAAARRGEELHGLEASVTIPARYLAARGRAEAPVASA